MSEISGRLLRGEELEELSDASPCCFDGSFVRLPDERLELCEHHLDGIEVWAVGRQEEEMRTDIANCIACRLSFMASQIVEDDDVTGLECRDQTLLAPCGKSDAIDGTVEYEGCHVAVAVSRPGRSASSNDHWGTVISGAILPNSAV